MKKTCMFILFHHFFYHLIATVGLKKNDATNTPRNLLILASVACLWWCAWLPGAAPVGKASVAFPQQCWRMWSLAAWRVHPLALSVEDMGVLGMEVYGKVRFITVTTWNHETLKQSSYRVVVWKMFGISFNPDFLGKWWPMLRTVRSWVVANNHQLVSTFGGLGLKKEQLFQLPPFWRRVQQVRVHADRPPQRGFRPNNKPKRTSGSQILAIFIEVHFGIYLWDAHDCLTPLTYQIV